MISSLPSPFTSPKATERVLDPDPIEKVCWLWNVPLPLPNKTLVVPEAVFALLFAVIISSLPSLFTSPKVTKVGVFPVAKVA